MDCNKILVLCPRETVTISAPAIQLAPEEAVGGPSSVLAEDAMEEMVVCLAAIEAAWASNEFKRLKGTLIAVAELAARTGLPDVAEVARRASDLTDGRDDVALSAVVARLVRIGEASLATLLEISYRQI